MDEDDLSAAMSQLAGAIGEPARARMLTLLMDGKARTASELSAAAGIGAATASGHLARLKRANLVRVHAQGRHRYYALRDGTVATLLEHLMVVGSNVDVPHTRIPPELRFARTCYDHIAGRLGVAMLDNLVQMRWLVRSTDRTYSVTRAGDARLRALGIDVGSLRRSRRRFAFDCLDWSERRPHLAGSLGAELLKTALERRWLRRDLAGRQLAITDKGKRELTAVIDPRALLVIE